MTVTISGTSGIVNDATDLNYTGTLTGGTGVVNLGSGQVYKDASGNVGIGTSSPATRLHVLSTVANAMVARFEGAFTAGNAVTLASFARAGAAVEGVIRYREPVDTIDFGTSTNHPVAFLTNNTERARIDSSGNLLVGTTTTAANAKLEVKNNSGLVVYFYNDAGTGVYLGAGATSWTAASDARIKTALVPFENAAAKVCTLRAGTGRYLADEETVSRSFLIAQDVQAVLPEAVNVRDDEIGTLGLQYTDVIPLLVAAIQEQQTLITALTARITALEAA